MEHFKSLVLNRGGRVELLGSKLVLGVIGSEYVLGKRATASVFT